MSQAIAGGRKTRVGIKLGICGEHGGDPSSVEFCHQLGLYYVSCSPYRVAIARLAAAHAALAEADARKAAKATLRKVTERKRSTAKRKKR
jgi:pyruvate,orthophosphate dikinase